jgi:hypothetical protein
LIFEFFWNTVPNVLLIKSKSWQMTIY